MSKVNVNAKKEMNTLNPTSLITYSEIKKGLDFKDPYNSLPIEIRGSGNKEKSYKNYPLTHIKIPFQEVCYGKTGARKTSYLMEKIRIMGCFNRFYLIVRKPDEGLYKSFIIKMRKLEKKLKRKLLFVSTNPDDLKYIKYNDKFNNLVILDDMINTKKNADAWQFMLNLYTDGRKDNVSVIFLTQIYFKLPDTMRENMNIFSIKRAGQKRKVKLVLNDISSYTDYTGDELYNLYIELIKNPLNTLVFNFDADESHRICNNMIPINVEETLKKIKERNDEKIHLIPDWSKIMNENEAK
jgi:hypothetical protein